MRIHQKFLRKSWESHEQKCMCSLFQVDCTWPLFVTRKSSEIHDKFMRRLWESHEKAMRKSWESHKKVMRKSGESHEKVHEKIMRKAMRKSWNVLRKSGKSHPKVLRKSWEIVYSIPVTDLSTHVFSCLYSQIVTDLRLGEKMPQNLFF